MFRNLLTPHPVPTHPSPLASSMMAELAAEVPTGRLPVEMPIRTRMPDEQWQAAPVGRGVGHRCLSAGAVWGEGRSDPIHSRSGPLTRCSIITRMPVAWSVASKHLRCARRSWRHRPPVEWGEIVIWEWGEILELQPDAWITGACMCASTRTHTVHGVASHLPSSGRPTPAVMRAGNAAD